MSQTDLNIILSRQLNTLETANIDYTNDIPSYCVSSATMEKNVLKQGAGEFFQKAQIHCIMLEPFAAGKSTLYEQIPDKAKHLLHNVTSPGFFGSIMKDGRIAKGIIQLAAGKCLIIDEVQNLPSSVKTAMLSLLEQQKYSRSIGYSSLIPRKEKKKYYSINIEDNFMDMRCRFSCLAGGNYAKKNTYVDKAWWSRMIPVQVTRDRKDMYDVIRGKGGRSIDYKPISRNFPSVVFPDKEYSYLVDSHEKISRVLPFSKKVEVLEEGFLTRNALDHARIACYLAARDGRTVVQRDDVDFVLNYVPVSLYNVLCSSLTAKEYLILSSWHKGMSNQNEIAQLIGTSQSYVSETLSDFKEKGLVW